MSIPSKSNLLLPRGWVRASRCPAGNEALATWGRDFLKADPEALLQEAQPELILGDSRPFFDHQGEGN
jgi:hypothetical protein